MRVTKAVVLALTVGACFPAGAIARRGAHGQQKAAILKASGVPSRAPLKCYEVFVSTVDKGWATSQYGGAVHGVCAPFGANGVSVVHFIHGHWHFVTAGSAFSCPIPGHIPQGVKRDLKLDCIPRGA